MGHPIFAAIYDRFLASTERAGLAETRAQVVGRATGRTLELGAGTGANLAHYSAAVTELVLTEPDPHMARRLEAKLAEAPPLPAAEVVAAAAEALPYEDASFDTVVSTLVLCSVESPQRASSEARRVLKPGGSLLLIEHVRATDDRGRARWQDRVERPWGWVAAGCHPNRDTRATLAAAGFDITALEPGKLPKAPPIVRPTISGVAIRS